MNHVVAKCGHSVVAVGAPGSPARAECETSLCDQCRTGLLPIGTRVRHSGHVIQPKRDYWNNQGSYEGKNRAKEWLDAAIAERGTVIGHLAADKSRGVSAGLQVKWDNGTVSHCLPYRVIAAE